jgi:Polyketide cyclase / dehydrase and lipid transport
VFGIEGEIVIERPVEEVFDFAADECNEPRYNPHMRRAEQLTDGPVGVGTRFRAEMTSMRRAIPMVTELTAYQRPRRYASTTQLSLMETSGTVTFEPISEGTLLRWAWQVEPRGALRAVTPIMARIGRRQEHAIWAGLKRVLEAHGGNATSRNAAPTASYRQDMRRAWDRIDSFPTRRLQTRFGTIEYADEGEGLPLLVSHGVLGCHVDSVDGLWANLPGSGFGSSARLALATSARRCRRMPLLPTRRTPTRCCSTIWGSIAPSSSAIRPEAGRSWNSRCIIPSA